MVAMVWRGFGLFGYFCGGFFEFEGLRFVSLRSLGYFFGLF
jgi:hypothetical protein